MKTNQLKILIISNVSSHATTLTDTLNMYGCIAYMQIKAEKGLIAAKTWKPHLIIIDVCTEGMNAWKFIFEYLLSKPTPRAYIVVMASYEQKHLKLLKRLNEECGMNKRVTKPFELHNLMTFVNDARKFVEAQK
jgi:CheY-like chemotaxis protein